MPLLGLIAAVHDVSTIITRTRLDVTVNLHKGTVTICTVLATFGTLPCSIRTTASTDHFRTALCKTEMVVQAYVLISAACTCTVAGSIRITGCIAGCYRAVGKVACRRISHCIVLLDTKQKRKKTASLSADGSEFFVCCSFVAIAAR